jgi:hypothetical protein
LKAKIGLFLKQSTEKKKFKRFFAALFKIKQFVSILEADL